MLSFDQAFNADKIKFTKSQVNESLYKYGHITKAEKDYLDKKDRKDDLAEDLQVDKFNFLSFAKSRLTDKKSTLKK